MGRKNQTVKHSRTKAAQKPSEKSKSENLIDKQSGNSQQKAQTKWSAKTRRNIRPTEGNI